jgi:hypothetical protein
VEVAREGKSVGHLALVGGSAGGPRVRCGRGKGRCRRVSPGSGEVPLESASGECRPPAGRWCGLHRIGSANQGWKAGLPAAGMAPALGNTLHTWMMSHHVPVPRDSYVTYPAHVIFFKAIRI